MDEVEALARAYCREMGLDPERHTWSADGRQGLTIWFVEEEAKRQLAWARAMEAVKR